MLNITLDTDFSDFPSTQLMDGKEIDLAIVRTLNKLIKWLQTHALRSIAKQTGVPQKTMRPRFKVSRAKKGELEAELWIGTYKIPLFKAANGKARQTKVGVSTRLKKVDGAFIATMGSGYTGIFKRLGKARFTIAEEKIDIHEAVEKSVIELLKAKTQRRFKELLEHELDYMFQKKRAA